MNCHKLILISLSLLTYTAVLGQGKAEKGVIIGVNNTSLHGTSVDGQDPILGDATLFPNQLGQSKTGYNLGFYLNKKIKDKFSYQLELGFSNRGLYNNYEDLNANINYLTSSHFLHLFPESKLSFLLGLEASLLQGHENWGELNVSEYDVGGVGGVSFKLPLTGISLTARYSHGFSNVTSVDLLGSSRNYRNRTFNIALQYEPFVNRRLYKNKPPLLVIEDINFSDPNSTINANEESEVTFSLKNTGLGMAEGVQVFVAISGETNGLSVPKKINIDKIKPNKSGKVTVPIKSSRKTKTGNLVVVIEVVEPNGFHPENSPAKITLPTQEFLAPMIEIVDHEAPEKWKAGEPVRLEILVQNTGQGVARDIRLDLSTHKMIFQDPNEIKYINKLLPGTSSSFVYDFMIPRDYDKSDVKISAEISESYGDYSKNWQETFVFNSKAASSNEIVFEATEEVEEINIDRASMPNEITFNKFDREFPIERIFVVANPSEDCDGNIQDGQDVANITESLLLGEYDVLERRYFEQILDEQKLAASGLLLEETAVELGCNAGSQGILFTEVGCLGGEKTINLKLVGCQTSEIYWSCVGIDASPIEVINRIKLELAK